MSEKTIAQQLEEAKKENADLVKSLDDSKAETETWQKMAEDAEKVSAEKITALESENKVLKGDVEQATADLEASKAEAEKLAAENKTLKEKLALGPHADVSDGHDGAVEEGGTGETPSILKEWEQVRATPKAGEFWKKHKEEILSAAGI